MGDMRSRPGEWDMIINGSLGRGLCMSSCYVVTLY